MIIPFAQTNFRNKSQVFGIKPDDRRRHMYIIGKTGTGKTTLLRNMMVSDVLAGNGVGILDPHGEFAEAILDYIPEHRQDDVIYFNPADLDFPIAFNAVEKVSTRERHLISSGLIAVFKKIWADSWGPRLEYVLRNAILALLEQEDSTLLGVMRILSDKEYRKKVVANVTDPVVRQFWVDEFGKYSSQFAVEAVAPIQNKVGQFLTNPMMRNIVGQQKSSINMRAIMDGKKILVMNLAKGKLGEDSSALMGAMLITKIQQAAMSRADIPNEEDRQDFFLYIDEFQNFATESFAGILSEARKYRLNLMLAHQYIAQLDETVRDSVFGNAGTLVAFRIGADDAEFLEKEFSPEVTALDLVNLPNHKIYLKLMIDGVASRAFSADTLPPIIQPAHSFKNALVAASRARYGTKRELVESTIMEWSAPVEQFVSPRTAGVAGIAGAVSVASAAASVKPDVELHDAVCDSCGTPIQVPFVPDPKRSVFCKNCLGKQRTTREKKYPAPEVASVEHTPPVSLADAVKTGPQRFQPHNNSAHIPKKDRKEPDLTSLRKILNDSLKNTHPAAAPQEAREKKEGDIHAEDIAKF
ncbi:MAG: type IV secretion system DNA-binding domain-containing protein [Patescibacteria group bacterium]